ncbi:MULTISPECIES: amidohydrolase [unclassified Streptomyces]|uniref:amidohydrolase n=1 Tax=unclassified Streptomyces TaxID=2593676 RepID=UPI000C18C63E|nr:MULTISPECIES: amidohydrolase [unclassified Streptomyces]MBQ0865466.1 amidohydrolase [Streptomyces sp. RK75]MBQ1121643.1 amidohydrolase [Streptomyces sp. B15]
MSDSTTPSRPRTLLLRGGEVHSPADPFATAMVVEGDSIAWIGTEGAADSFADGVDEVVHLDGALVTPAFTDAHVHTTATGLALTGLDLSGAPTLADALAQVRAYAKARPDDRVLLGTGWDAHAWPEQRHPSRAELDEASGGRPLYLTRIDVHSALADTAMLDLVPDITTREGYRPDAPLTGDAHHAVREAAYATLTPRQRTEAQRAARAHAASLGIGALHECAGPDISGEDDLRGLLALAAEEPGPRVHGYWAELVTSAKEAARIGELGVVGAAGDLFADGSLGSHTAHLCAPYADAPHTSGSALLDAEAVAAHVAACTEAGLQAGFHAIGDAALQAVTEGVRRAAETVGPARVRAARHRVEHAEMLTEQTLADFADLALTASVQPGFDAAWGGADGMYARRLGAERAASLNPYAALLRAGVPLALGSDSPVTPLGPWEAIRAAAFHRTHEHRISVRGAFTAHTRGGWRALGRDDAGVLVPGAPADYALWRTGPLVVQAPDTRVANWSTDPRSGTPGLPDLTPGGQVPVCLRTVVGGRTVYARPDE